MKKWRNEAAAATWRQHTDIPSTRRETPQSNPISLMCSFPTSQQSPLHNQNSSTGGKTLIWCQDNQQILLILLNTGVCFLLARRGRNGGRRRDRQNADPEGTGLQNVSSCFWPDGNSSSWQSQAYLGPLGPASKCGGRVCCSLGATTLTARRKTSQMLF